MNELMERMQGLLDEARQQGIAEALAAVKTWRDGIDRSNFETDSEYFDGIDDAVLTIEQM